MDGVEIRIGVDTDDDGEIDQWSGFTKIKETYSQKKGFVKVVEAIPATLNVSELEAGYAFKVEFRFSSKDGVFPELDSFETEFVE